MDIIPKIEPFGASQVIHVPPLTVMSFNVLAEYLSDLFSFQFVVVDAETCNGDFLDWNARKSQVIGEVLRWTPQVLCLQELDRRHWPELEQELGQWGGYESSPYTARKGRNGTEVLDGICTLYDPTKWRLVDSKAIPLESGEEGKLIVGAVTITTLQMLGPQQRAERVALVACNAHVGWERDSMWMEKVIQELHAEAASRSPPLTPPPPL